MCSQVLFRNYTKELNNLTLDDLTLDTCDCKNIEHFDMEWFILYLDPSSRSMNSRNTYLVCRMFWCDDAVHSDVCWNDPQPPYNFSQVCIKRKIFYRVCGNVTLMHVWCTMYLVKKNFFVRFVYNILYLSDCSSVGFTKSAGTNEEQLHGCGDLGQENKCRE